MYLGPRLGSPWPHLGHISDKQHGAGCQPGLSAVLSPCWTKWKWQRDCKHCPYVPFQKTNNMAAKKDLILRKFTTVRLIMKLQDTFGKNFIPNRGSCFDIASKNIFIDSTLWRISNKQKKKFLHFFTFVILATFSWTCNQTSEDIPAGESRITAKNRKISSVNTSHNTNRKPPKYHVWLYHSWHNKENLQGIYYQLVFRVLYREDASFDLNQHQQSGHLVFGEKPQKVSSETWQRT